MGLRLHLRQPSPTHPPHTHTKRKLYEYTLGKKGGSNKAPSTLEATRRVTRKNGARSYSVACVTRCLLRIVWTELLLFMGFSRPSLLRFWRRVCGWGLKVKGAPFLFFPSECPACTCQCSTPGTWQFYLTNSPFLCFRLLRWREPSNGEEKTCKL